jgi:hypothetical protein
MLDAKPKVRTLLQVSTYQAFALKGNDRHIKRVEQAKYMQLDALWIQEERMSCHAYEGTAAYSQQTTTLYPRLVLPSGRSLNVTIEPVHYMKLVWIGQGHEAAVTPWDRCDVIFTPPISMLLTEMKIYHENPQHAVRATGWQYRNAASTNSMQSLCWHWFDEKEEIELTVALLSAIQSITLSMHGQTLLVDMQLCTMCTTSNKSPANLQFIRGNKCNWPFTVVSVFGSTFPDTVSISDERLLSAPPKHVFSLNRIIF